MLYRIRHAFHGISFGQLIREDIVIATTAVVFEVIDALRVLDEQFLGK
jgi:hypothetical protein